MAFHENTLLPKKKIQNLEYTILFLFTLFRVAPETPQQHIETIRQKAHNKSKC